MQVAMLADIRIAAENSQFGIPAARLGIAYGFDACAIWSRWSAVMGTAPDVYRHAIDSAEAARIGLVNRVVPDTELWGATLDIARTISHNAPLPFRRPR